MIQIVLSNEIYENDVHSLVKAFYPVETIKFYSQEEVEQEGVELEEAKQDEIKQEEAKQEEIKQGEAKQEDFLLEETGSSTNNSTHSSSEVIIQIRIDFYEAAFAIKIIDPKGELHTKSLDTVSSVSEKLKYKNTFKRELYALLAGISNRELPWGILTGIRPTKIVYEMADRGMEEGAIREHMIEEYLCSEDKISSSYRIAMSEMELLKAMDYQNGYSLYIGIPFCPSTCLYCSFTSYSIERFADRVEEYLVALEKEIIYGATCFPNKKLTTVYLGGGTPTTLTADQLDRLLGLVKKHFDFSHVKEFCVEAGRPDSINRSKLEVLKRWGVDRISINPQSMQQRTLDLIGRWHTVDQIKSAFRLARETGHENINMDLIIGLPGEKPEDVSDTLAQIKELNPDSITVHTLALKRAARLNTEKQNYEGLTATEVPAMLETTMDFAKENDYLPYYLYRQKNMADNLENIGYARYGKEGLYNILIMEEQQTILALGAGGMSKFVFHKENRIERVDNVKSVTDYIDRIDEMIERKRSFLSHNKLQ